MSRFLVRIHTKISQKPPEIANNHQNVGKLESEHKPRLRGDGYFDLPKKCSQISHLWAFFDLVVNDGAQIWFIAFRIVFVVVFLDYPKAVGHVSMSLPR